MSNVKKINSHDIPADMFPLMHSNISVAIENILYIGATGLQISV
jgi:hypothetical protein